MYLKPATVEDAPIFVRMERASGTKEFVIPYDLETHQTLIVDQDVTYLSVMDQDELVGFMILRQDDTKSVEFRRIVIEKQGRGYGQRALQAMEHYCFHQLGCSRIWLDVFASNARGVHIYRKWGYTEFGCDVHQGQRLLLMDKTRSPALPHSTNHTGRNR
ncbi:GNAT family N-acetyltransferase [Vibrio coralliilyticus]|uniref:GNAT family N-acetyltransferase n=1 Tax=Vibrio coralliilyticus TaxID=190893 RepID=UPI000BAA97B0|nr:GNAT family N-acetyltransferase [Vibrio coralliilyticus]NOI58992.1 GNAT family N-acetyltransferase [Vibrio coralliilyticus]PAT66764.1 hypothetical protein CKA27_18140 [Vibrio coralliilyticus]